MNNLIKTSHAFIIIISLFLASLNIIFWSSEQLSIVAKNIPIESIKQTAAVGDFDSSKIHHETFDSGGSTGIVGQAKVFASLTDKVNTPINTSTLTGGFTISFWANPTALAFNKFAYSASDQGADRFYFRQDTGTSAVAGLGSWNPAISSAFSTDKWTHYVITLDGTTGKIYKNNSVVASNSNITVALPNSVIAIGASKDSTANTFFTGSLDDFRIYNRALTVTEIDDLYILGGGAVAEVDTTPPSVPANVTATAISSSRIDLSWSASTGGATGYRVYKDGSQITTTANTSYSNTGLTPATSYSYTVASYDDDSNVSAQSSSVSASTPAGSGSPIDGQCSTTLNTCTTPTPATNIRADANNNLWTCPGTNNGNPASCSSPITTGGRQPTVSGNEVTAYSCEQVDVQAALNIAQTGNIVNIPAGTCTWTSTFNFNKAVTLKGAGVDQTTLINGVSHTGISSCGGCTRPQIIIMSSSNSGLTRITNMTIDGGSGTIDGQNNGFFLVYGSSKNWRIDHMRFRVTRTSAITAYAPGGLIDNNRFDIIGWYVSIYGKNGGGENGDPVWAQDTELGTDNALYIEDNTFYSSTPSLGLDGWMGQRVVVRFNNFNNSRAGNHGTESGNRLRGSRSYEIYNNTFNKTNGDNYSDAVGIRGGVGVVFNNTLSGSFTMVGSMHNYRDLHPYSPWGQCDGTSPFDLNDLEDDNSTLRVYDTGTSDTNSVYSNNNITLTDSDKSWTAGQWIGYSIWNTTKNLKSPITSNTATTITSPTDNNNNSAPLSWSNGDSFKIIRASMCIDQVGRGKGVLISGGQSNPTPRAWTQQELDPTYIWNNTLNGSYRAIGDTSVHIVEGRDYYNNTCKPGYSPYTYPHPLTGLSPQTVPLNCNGGTPAQTYNLSVSKQGTGSGTVSGGSISCGSICSMTGSGNILLLATPSNGSAFTGWSGACTGSSSICSVSLSSNQTVTATFGPGTLVGTPAQCSTTLNSCSTGTLRSGSQSSNSTHNLWTCDGLNGGAQASCSVLKTLPPTPGQCSTTLNLCTSGNPEGITANTTHNIWTCGGTNGGEAISCSKLISNIDLTPTTNLVTVNKTGSGSGTVTGTGISCGSDCTHVLPINTAITLTATPNSGYVFSSWSGGYCSGSNNTCTITPTTDATVIARFSIIPTAINGLCSTTLNSCTTGRFSERSDNTTHSLWSCQGTNGGTNVDCSSVKPAVPPPVYNPPVQPVNYTPTPYVYKKPVTTPKLIQPTPDLPPSPSFEPLDFIPTDYIKILLNLTKDLVLNFVQRITRGAQKVIEEIKMLSS